MDANENTNSFFRFEDAFLVLVWAVAVSFLFSSQGFAAQCSVGADPVYSAQASGPEIDRVRLEYTGLAGRSAAQPADLKLTLYRGKDCVAQCRSTQPLKANELDVIDFRCSAPSLSALGTLATLRIGEGRLQLGSFVQGYQTFALERSDSRMPELARTLRAEAGVKSAAAAPIRTGLRENP